MALRQHRAQGPAHQGAADGPQGAQHLEGPVEPGPLGVRDVGLGGRDADVVGGDPQQSIG